MKMWQLLADNNQLHSNIKRLEANAPEKFKKLGIHQCGHCAGTGLEKKNLEKACKKCFGVGYVGFKMLNDDTICPDCNSTGYQLEYQNHVTSCETCEGSGRLDWVDAVRKGIDLEKIW